MAIEWDLLVMRHYCTYFDCNFLVRGVTLYRSLEAHAGPFVLWVLCFDDFTYDVLTKLGLPNLRPIALAEFEQGDEALLQVKARRSRVEYFFTCSPSLPLYIMRQAPEIDLVTYLDADLYFYDSPEPCFAELGENSILIIAHRFPARLQQKEIHGKYNVGMLAFRNDAVGRACLEWWRERCLEWCHDRVEDGKYADQKYLDDWPTRFPGVVVLQHPGANLAPWNWMNYRPAVQDGKLSVDGLPVIFYHFHGVKLFTPWLYDTGLGWYGAMPKAMRAWLYTPYIQALKDTAHWVSQTVADVTPGYVNMRYGLKNILGSALRRQLVVETRARHLAE